jgi:CRISPR-associated protein Cas2
VALRLMVLSLRVMCRSRKLYLVEISAKINPQVESLYVYRVANPKNIQKIVYGTEKDFETVFL